MIAGIYAKTRTRIAAEAAVLLVCAGLSTACAQTLDDFGYGLMTREGTPALGTHPAQLTQSCNQTNPNK